MQEKNSEKFFVSCYMSTQTTSKTFGENVVTAALHKLYAVDLCDWTGRATNEFVELAYPICCLPELSMG